MDIEKAYRALQRVAEQEHITVDQVIQNIDEVIEIGMASPDPSVKARWASIPCVGKVPTAVELVAFIAESVLSEYADS